MSSLRAEAPAPAAAPWSAGRAPEAESPAAVPPSTADAWPRTPADPQPDAPAAPPWKASATPSPVTRDADDEYDDYDDEPDRRVHPYTWLHILVLAVVAFVLGFLIMLLVIQARGTNGEETAAASWPVGVEHVVVTT